MATRMIAVAALLVAVVLTLMYHYSSSETVVATTSTSRSDLILIPERAIEGSDAPGTLAECQLIPGYQRGELGLPIEAFVRLYAVCADRAPIQIAGPGDLEPYVDAVQTAAQALAFVRLFTKPATVHMFPGEALVNDVSISADTLRRVGVLTPTLGRHHGVSEARVDAEGEGFTIERTLVSATAVGAPRRLIRRIEHVSRQGAYKHVGDMMIAELPADTVLMPFVE